MIGNDDINPFRLCGFDRFVTAGAIAASVVAPDGQPFTETEAQLIEHLHHAGGDRTVVVAGHRLSSVRDADRILVLDRGQLIAEGAPEDT